MAGRGQPPKVENRPDRAEILAAILTPGAKMAEIQRRFKVSEKALDTFRKKHVSPAMRAAMVMVEEATEEAPILQRDIARRIAKREDTTEAEDDAYASWLHGGAA